MTPTVYIDTILYVMYSLQLLKPVDVPRVHVKPPVFLKIHAYQPKDIPRIGNDQPSAFSLEDVICEVGKGTTL